MKYHYRKEVGCKVVLNTRHPVYAVAYGSARRYVSGLLWNGIARSTVQHRTRQEAIARAEELAAQKEGEVERVAPALALEEEATDGR